MSTLADPYVLPDKGKECKRSVSSADGFRLGLYFHFQIKRVLPLKRHNKSSITQQLRHTIKELVARPMYISLYHFIVLVLIIHILRYHTRQDNYYFIRKVIDKKTKIKSKCCRGGGLNLCSLKTSVFPELKIFKILPL